MERSERLMPDMSIRNKTVIISGAARGIGRAIAIDLAREGANISFNFLKSYKDAEDLEKEIKNFGVKVKSFQVDIRDYDAVKSWVDNTKELFGGIDIAVNNAGVMKEIPLCRFGRPEEVARVVRFLISDEAGYITGQTIVIDGGMSP